MTNYLDEYNKRKTYGNAMGYAADPLAQTAHMHADRDRQQQSSGASHHGGPAHGIHFNDGDAQAGLPRALLIFFGGATLLFVSVWAIESLNGIFQILGMIGAGIGFLFAAFGAVITFLIGLVSIGTIIRQKTFWAIAAASGLSCLALSVETGITAFLLLMLSWAAFTGGKRVLARFKQASKTD